MFDEHIENGFFFFFWVVTYSHTVRGGGRVDPLNRTRDAVFRRKHTNHFCYSLFHIENGNWGFVWCWWGEWRASNYTLRIFYGPLFFFVTDMWLARGTSQISHSPTHHGTPLIVKRMKTTPNHHTFICYGIQSILLANNSQSYQFTQSLLIYIIYTTVCIFNYLSKWQRK